MMHTADYEGHTPGPWTLVEEEFAIRDDQGCDVILFKNQCSDEFDSFDDMAAECTDCASNARLIAAAPDLLRRLIKAEELIDELGNQEYPHYYWDGEEYRFRYEGSDEE